ncbi:MAG: extracellular solute-binding protein [Clostridiales bacterium]|jgi:ABC-type glycerol-3-phosphate transport system substrate-binding protein|nr:extracellular solute-binding protein [Clostridiales bacterium]
MKRVVKIFLVIFITSAMLFGVMACKPTTPQPTGDVNDVKGRIRFQTIGSTTAGGESVYSAADAIIGQFKQDYPNVSVERVEMPDTTVRTVQVSSGTIGDVFWLNESEDYQFAITDEALIPLNDYLSTYKINMDNVYGGIIELGRINGQIYMIARDYNQLVMFYNKTQYEKEGFTIPDGGYSWDQFSKDCVKLTHTDNDNKYTQTGADFGDFEGIYIAFMFGWGGTPFDVDHKTISLVSDDKVFQGLNAYFQAMKAGWMKQVGINDAYVSGFDQTNSIFNFGIFPNMSSFDATYSAKSLDWDVTTMPKFDIRPTVTCGASGHGVSVDSKNKDAAAAFCTYFWTEKGQLAYNSQEGASIPPIQSLAEQDFWKVPFAGKNYDAFVSNPEYNEFARFGVQLPNAVSTKLLAANTGLSAAFTKALKGSVDLKDALQALEKTANDTWANQK